MLGEKAAQGAERGAGGAGGHLRRKLGVLFMVFGRRSEPPGAAAPGSRPPDIQPGGGLRLCKADLCDM